MFLLLGVYNCGLVLVVLIIIDWWLWGRVVIGLGVIYKSLAEAYFLVWKIVGISWNSKICQLLNNCWMSVGGRLIASLRWGLSFESNNSPWRGY